MKEEGHASYAPTRWNIRYVLKRYLRGRITHDDAIIDIGCGKGKMIYFFSKFPFGRIDGLEYSRDVADIAEKNIRKLRRGGGG